MKSANPVVGTLDIVCRQAGFHKKSGAWRREVEDLTQLVQLQKSNYGEVYYLNIGFWFTDIANEVNPAMQRAHLQARAEILLPRWKSELKLILDLRVPLSDDDRAVRIVEFMESGLIPLMDSSRNVQTFRTPEGRQLMERMMVTGDARSLVDATS